MILRQYLEHVNSEILKLKKSQREHGFSTSSAASTCNPSVRSYSLAVITLPLESQFGLKILLSPAMQSAINCLLILIMREKKSHCSPCLSTNSLKLECEMNPLCCLWLQVLPLQEGPIYFHFLLHFLLKSFFFFVTKEYTPNLFFTGAKVFTSETDCYYNMGSF